MVSNYKSHPKFQEIQQYNSRDTLQSQAAFLVYLDLCEVKEWWGVGCEHSVELDVVVLRGRPSRHAPYQTVVPVPAGRQLSPTMIQHLISVLGTETPSGLKSVTFALMESDTTVVYYVMTNGLVPPDTPEVGEAKKKLHERKLRLSRGRQRRGLQAYCRGDASGVSGADLEQDTSEEESDTNDTRAQVDEEL